MVGNNYELKLINVIYVILCNYMQTFCGLNNHLVDARTIMSGDQNKFSSLNLITRHKIEITIAWTSLNLRVPNVDCCSQPKAKKTQTIHFASAMIPLMQPF